MDAVVNLSNVLYIIIFVFLMTDAKGIAKDEVDKVIEDEITQKLSEDLLQSIEKKFHVDLERSVDSVLLKIKLLLQNGTVHIQEKLLELQELMDVIRKDNDKAVEVCLDANQNETTALAEKALHQMVICGYALIGHDPANAVRNVMELKNMIKHGLKPMYENRQDIYNLLKICGHDHDSLKKVIKCVIAKSPQLKTAMMGVSGKLIDGVISLTKQMAHGAMHEACLIEVLKTVEEDALFIVNKIKGCAYSNESNIKEEVEKYIQENNATILDIEREKEDDKPVVETETEKDTNKETTDVDVKNILRRMLKESKIQETLDKKLNENAIKAKKIVDETNSLSNTAINKD